MSLIIRRATASDLDGVTRLFRETIETINSKDYSFEQTEAWKKGALKIERWERKISEQYFLVCEIDRKIVGFGSITHEGYLDFMYASKDHQGQGIASLIYNSLEKFVIEKEVDRIISDVSITARHFFERRGFEVLHEQQVDIDGVILTNYKMQKQLSLP